MPAIGAERKAQLGCRGLLFWRRIKISEVENAIHSLVALTRKQCLGGICEQSLQRLWRCGAWPGTRQQPRVQECVPSEQISLSIMTKRVLDRAFKIGACQQRHASQAPRPGRLGRPYT